MASAAFRPPFYPIIYVRGYAGGDDEVEDTAADPYMGFNLGSTKLRQLWTGDVVRHYFESPIVRLMKDHGYRDVYSGGAEMSLDRPLPARSIFIYRYYDKVSSQLGFGQRREIEEFAEGLGELILRVRDRICGNSAAKKKAFRVYLVAHSMGGLICRCFLQNPKIGKAETKKVVDKIFTYATPHNGIDLQVIGNIPGFFTRNNADNFNRDRMCNYLALPKTAKEDVSSLNGAFDAERFFCLVGTNAGDYEVARGWSRRVVGPMSDGLVRITNATVWGPDGSETRVHSPRAFVHRSHSGHYGIVNSEEGFQNLARFLFGDIRVDGILEVKSITLPKPVEDAKKKGKAIRASYHFECVARVRGATWDLHRRTVQENSAVFRTFDEMLRTEPGQTPRHPHLFSIFLSKAARVNEKRASLGFSVDLAVQVPEYEVDGLLWLDSHYAGGYLFRDKLNLEATPPTTAKGAWALRYGFDSESPNQTLRDIQPQKRAGGVTFRIPIVTKTTPGIDAQLVLTGRPWNR